MSHPSQDSQKETSSGFPKVKSKSSKAFDSETRDLWWLR